MSATGFLTTSRIPRRAAPGLKRSAVRCAAQLPQPQQPKPKASAIPTPDEDREVAHTAFMDAFTAAQPETVRIRGMQEFASAILARERIPSQAYSDPLAHIFQEFDVDKDGWLAAAEVGEALRSRDVAITDEQVQMFIDVVDVTHSHKVKASEFRDLVLHMAAADLHSRREGEPGNYIRCTLDSDDEIQDKLKSWVDTLMARRYR